MPAPPEELRRDSHVRQTIRWAQSLGPCPTALLHAGTVRAMLEALQVEESPVPATLIVQAVLAGDREMWKQIIHMKHGELPADWRGLETRAGSSGRIVEEFAAWLRDTSSPRSLEVLLSGAATAPAPTPGPAAEAGPPYAVSSAGRRRPDTSPSPTREKATPGRGIMGVIVATGLAAFAFLRVGAPEPAEPVAPVSERPSVAGTLLPPTSSVTRTVTVFSPLARKQGPAPPPVVVGEEVPLDPGVVTYLDGRPVHRSGRHLCVVDGDLSAAPGPPRRARIESIEGDLLHVTVEE